VYVIAFEAADFVAVNKKVITVGITAPICASVVVILNGYFHLPLVCGRQYLPCLPASR
jgi:hypothetical protein